MELVKHNEIEEKIIILRDIPVILDSDVAAIYEVETKRINEAVKNNPDKFPQGYLIELNQNEKKELVEIFDQFNKLKRHSHIYFNTCFGIRNFQIIF